MPKSNKHASNASWHVQTGQATYTSIGIRISSWKWYGCYWRFLSRRRWRRGENGYIHHWLNDWNCYHILLLLIGFLQDCALHHSFTFFRPSSLARLTTPNIHRQSTKVSVMVPMQINFNRNQPIIWNSPTLERFDLQNLPHTITYSCSNLWTTMNHLMLPAKLHQGEFRVYEQDLNYFSRKECI